jgi:hypothetical protein
LLGRANVVTERRLDRWAKGAATGAPVNQRRGAVFIVTAQPAHDGVRAPIRALGDFSGTAAVGDVMQRKEPLAAARRVGAQGQLAQSGRRLVPTFRVNV